MKLAGSVESVSTSQTLDSVSDASGGLFGLFAARFKDAREAHALFNRFLKQKNYSSEFTLKLIETAREPSSHSWELRMLAALMLEREALKIPPDDFDEFDRLFVSLGLKPSAGTSVRMNESVLKDGYSTTSLRGFTREFRRRLERLRRVHEPLDAVRVSQASVLDFISFAKRECKLTLARYLLRPDEVFRRILERVERSTGVVDLNHTQAFYVNGEMEEALLRLPDAEAALIKRLRAESYTYWVADSTSSEINSLVEYPLTTVVLVIKPPGSDTEFEIKRAGRRGRNKLGVVHSREGKEVPQSHRLDGGSMQWLLRWEMNQAAHLSRVYRITHGEPPPMPQYFSRVNLRAMPSGGDESQILDYFTDPRAFGKGFREMREAMKYAVRSFEEEYGSKSLPLQGDLGLTVQYLGFVTPCQAILAGTTSFRIDRLRAYLSADGPDTYFRKGLDTWYSAHDARQFADEILEEVLGIYEPPRTRYRGHERYVSDAFAVAENRARADETYLSLMRQAGKFWGTLMAVRGYTWGESFVARNVGLKSVWERGRWRVKLIFMDHDNLQMYGRETRNFHPETALSGMWYDEEYFLGESNNEYTVVGTLQMLEEIYRVGESLGRRGKSLFRRSLKKAYVRTHQQAEVSTHLQRTFDKVFLKRLRVWDEFVRIYLRAKDESWKDEATKFLKSKGYTKRLINEHLKVAEDYSVFIKRYSFLYDDKYLSFRRS